MCGRFTINVSKEEMLEYLNEYYGIEEYDNDIRLPRYNVAPGQNIIAIINVDNKNRAGLLKWGLIPFFSKDEKSGYKMINAKSETLGDKLSFKDSFKNKRCIILADSFYEWIRDDKDKIPVRIMLKSNSIFPMAGLWSSYTRSDNTKLYTCTIITTSANDIVSPIHHRMPVILTNETKDIWLDSNIKDLDILSKILIPYNPNKMYTYKVSKLVNNSANDLPECINSL